MKHTIAEAFSKWKWNAIVTIGGLLIGAGFADCIYAISDLDLNQIARGLTIFSAGLTIIVVMDTSKAQKRSDKVQLETQLQLQKLEQQLNAIEQSQLMSEKQLKEIKTLLHKANI